MNKLTLTQYAASILLALTVGSTALADEERPTEGEETIITIDRNGVITDIVGTWNAKKSFSEGWEEEFTAALNGASDEQLLAIQVAESYNAVNAILQGREAPAVLEGVAGIEALGDLTTDLLYSAVVPCRFFDTRFDNIAGKGHTTGATATTHSYRVHGTAGALVHQGYNKGVNAGAGCPAPKGEPVGIVGNFTAAGPLSNGNIRAWPTGGSLPNVSLVNYTTGTNIANAGIVSTGYLLGDDINVTMQYGSVDSLGDVMGYFYPAVIAPLSSTALHGYDLAQGTITSTNNNVFIDPANGGSTFTFAGGEEVLWRNSAMVYRSGGAGNSVTGTFEACYRNTANNALTCHGFIGQTDFCIQSTGLSDMKSVQTAGQVSSMPAGTYEFGFRASLGGSSCSTANNYVVYSSKISVVTFQN